MRSGGRFWEGLGFLPIVGRELRLTSRRRGYYLSRLILAFAAIVVGAFVYMGNADRTQMMAGRFLFWVLAGGALGYAFFAGANYTSDTLSSEKREGTLGLLFLTDLTGFDVVLGKLASSSLTGFYTLLAGFPIMAIPMLMGGVTAGEFWRLALVVVNTFLFSMAAGMLASAWQRAARASASTASLLIMWPTMFMPGIGGFLLASQHVRGVPIGHEWLVASPGFAFYAALDANHAREGGWFWFSMLVIHGLTWLFVGLASWAAPRSWQDRPAKAVKPGFRVWWRQQRFGSPRKRLAVRKEMLDRNAYSWLMARDCWKQRIIWAIPSLMIGLPILVWLMAGRDAEQPAVLAMVGFVANFAFKLWVTSECCEQIRRDREAGALEMVLSTTLSTRDLLLGVELALKRMFLRPLVASLVIAWLLVAMCWLWINPLKDPDYSRTDLVAVAVAMTGMLFLDLVSISAVGVYFAVTTKIPKQASGITAANILVLPWLVYGGIAAFLGLARSMGIIEGDWGWPFWLGMWITLGLVADLWFGLTARRRLMNGQVRLRTQQFARRIEDTPT